MPGNEYDKADPGNLFISFHILLRKPYLCRPFTSSGDGARLIETNINNFCKRKKY